MKSKEVEELIETLEKEVSELPLDRDVYEEKLKSYGHLLHPNHHIMIDLKFTLVQVIFFLPFFREINCNPLAESSALKMMKNVTIISENDVIMTKISCKN